MSKNAFQSAVGCAIITLFALAVPARAATSYVQNGSFSTTSGAGQVNYNSETLTDWTNESSGGTLGYNFLFTSTDFDNGTGVNGDAGDLQLWGPGNGSANGLGASPDGGNFLADDGAYEAAPIQQTINSANLTPGDNYVVGFWWGGAQQEGFTGPNSEQWQVTLDGVTENTVILQNASEGFTGWYYQTLTFTVEHANPVLSFFAVGTPVSPSEPPFVLLDGVSLTLAPEPGTFALIGFALLGAPMIHRLVRKRAARSSTRVSTRR